MGKKTRAEDGFLWVAVNNFPKGIYIQQVGCGDDIANGDHVGGPDFMIDESTSGNHDLEWQFLHLFYMKAGVCHTTDFDKNDRVSFGTYAPAASGASSNPGAGDYDKSLVAAGKYRYKPVTAGTGDWDMTLTDTLNANVAILKATPFPNPYGTGYFNYDPTTNVLSDAPNGNGAYDVLDHDKELATFVHKIPVEAEITLSTDGIIATPVLPGWKFRVRYERAVASAFTCKWRLVMGHYEVQTNCWGDA